MMGNNGALSDDNVNLFICLSVTDVKA